MSVLDFWKSSASSRSCRIFGVGGNYQQERSLHGSIFDVPRDEQPIFVIDNTSAGEGLIHNTLDSHLIEHGEGPELDILYDVAILESDSNGVNVSTVFVNFHTSDGTNISREKIVTKLTTGRVNRVFNQLEIPSNSKFYSIRIFANKLNKISICYSNFSNIDDREPADQNSSNNDVIMTVFNNFKNDTRVLREAKALLDLGLNVRIMAIYSTGQIQEEEIEGVRVSRVILTPFHLRWMRWWSKRGAIGQLLSNIIRRCTKPFHRYIMFHNFEKRVLEILDGEQVAVCHSHDLNTLRLGTKIAKRNGGKLIYDSHELYADRNRARKAGLVKRRLIKFYEKRLVKKCDAIITVNSSIAEILCRRYGVEDVKIIMNTPPMQFFPPDNKGYDLRDILGIRKEMRTIIYVGSIQRNRGIENLVTSLRYMKDVHLILMGYGNDELVAELDRIALENNVEDRFSKFGPVPSELVPLYTSSADIGVAPILNSCLSYYLCSPNKVFEYIHAGIPVVSSDFPEMKKVVIGENIGLVFDPEDPESIANSVTKLLEDEAYRQEMALNSIKCSKKYNWGIESSKLQRMYIKLFDGAMPSTTLQSNVENSSKIDTIMLRRQASKLSEDIEIENCLPGQRGWGSPTGRESSKSISINLESQLIPKGNEISVRISSGKITKARVEIYRIGYYGGSGSRKISDLGIFDMEKKSNGVASVVVKIATENEFKPGMFILKITGSMHSISHPFWIHGAGDILVVVPTIANSFSEFPTKSREKQSVFTNRGSLTQNKGISVDIGVQPKNGRGGKILKWTLPFCKWAERNNIVISWITDHELNSNPEVAKEYQKMVLLGNSRFWTKEMHGVIGRHIASGGKIINLGVGMGEQLIENLGNGKYQFILADDDSDGDGPICSNWHVSGSMVRFGGITEDSLLLDISPSTPKDQKFSFTGSWDFMTNESLSYDCRKILQLKLENDLTRDLEIGSYEIRLDSGAQLFLANFENWVDFLDEQIFPSDHNAVRMRDYLSKILTNEAEREGNRLEAVRNSIAKIVEKEWGGRRLTRQDELRGIDRKEVRRICFLTSIWKRKELTGIFLDYINHLKQELQEFDLTLLVVGSEGEESKKMVLQSGNEYLEYENLPLSYKWDAGLKHTINYDPDMVIILGSDDFISPITVRMLVEEIRSGKLFSGVMDMQVLDSMSSELYQWDGYRGSSPHRKWETIGMARSISRKLLNFMDFSLWSNEPINRGLDGLMTRNLSAVGLLPIPYGQDVQIALEDGNYLFGHTGIRTTDFEGLAVDVKTNHNISPLENYNLTDRDIIKESRSLLERDLGVTVADEILGIGE